MHSIYNEQVFFSVFDENNTKLQLKLKKIQLGLYDLVGYPSILSLQQYVNSGNKQQ